MSTPLTDNEIRKRRTPLPTMDDLPSEEIGDPGMPDEYHVLQALLLRETFRPPTVPLEEVFSAVDINLYYDPRHPRWYKRPDWFGVVGVPRLLEGGELRSSYVMWEEGLGPLIVVELLSPATEKSDLGQIRDAAQEPTKWQVYEQILRVPYYVTYNGATGALRMFRLTAGRYEPVPAEEKRLLLPSLELGLGVWHGSHEGLERHWLRFFDQEGNLIPTTQELMESERLRAESAENRLAQERAEKEKLAAKLRELGIDPESL